MNTIFTSEVILLLMKRCNNSHALTFERDDAKL